MSTQRANLPTTLVVTPPTAEAAVTLALVKQHRKVMTPDEDVLLQQALAAAVEWVEDFTGLALSPRTLDLRLDAWPEDGEVILPGVPLTSVTHVKYYDPAGVLQTLDAGAYIVTGVGARVACGRVLPLPGGAGWPALQARPEAVQVRYVCGCASPALVPAKAVQAVLLLVGDMHEHREPSITGTIVSTIETCTQLLWQLRAERVA